MLEKDQSEAENASIPSMYVSKTDGGHQAAYLTRTRSLVGCRQVCPLRIQMKDWAFALALNE